MLKVIVTQKIIKADTGAIEWRCCTENGIVPERFYEYPDENGDMTLMKVYPVWDMDGVETWGERMNSEEVEVWSTDWFEAEHMPRNARWFIDKRV